MTAGTFRIGTASHSISDAVTSSIGTADRWAAPPTEPAPADPSPAKPTGKTAGKKPHAAAHAGADSAERLDTCQTDAFSLPPPASTASSAASSPPATATPPDGLAGLAPPTKSQVEAMSSLVHRDL